MNPIRLVDLAAQNAEIRPDLDAAVAGVFDRGAFVLGEEVRRFEEEFAAAYGFGHAVGCNSGTDALVLALEALVERDGPGEVVTTPFSFFATAEAVLRAGLALRFADVDAESLELSPEAAAAACGTATRAILPVHLYGACADIEALARIGPPIVEDAAQAVGATYRGRPAGALGLLAAFSFYPTKNLAAAGDAGAVTTADADLAGVVRSLRAHGETRGEGDRSYHYLRLGHNSRLDGIQAAVLRVKLRHLERWQQRREENAAFYDEALSGVGSVVPAPRAPFGRHVYHQYVIRSPRRDALREHLTRCGVETRVFYPEPLHLQPALKGLGGKQGQFPAAERACREVLSLPVHPHLGEADRERVVSAIRAF